MKKTHTLDPCDLDPSDIDDLTLLTTAHHEAGHAVVHLLHGGTVNYIEVYRRGGANTSTADTAKDNPVGYAVALMAGPEAGAHYLTTQRYPLRLARRELRRPDSADLAELRGIGVYSESRARALARRLVLSHWRHIERVAADLIRSGGYLPGTAIA